MDGKTRMLNATSLLIKRFEHLFFNHFIMIFYNTMYFLRTEQISRKFNEELIEKYEY